MPVKPPPLGVFSGEFREFISDGDSCTSAGELGRRGVGLGCDGRLDGRIMDDGLPDAAAFFAGVEAFFAGIGKIGNLVSFTGVCPEARA